MKTITLRLDDKLHKKLKMYAVENEITIQDLLVKLVIDTVDADNEGVVQTMEINKREIEEA